MEAGYRSLLTLSSYGHSLGVTGCYWPQGGSSFNTIFSILNNRKRQKPKQLLAAFPDDLLWPNKSSDPIISIDFGL